MGALSKLFRGLKKIVGTVAMIAAPFIAGPIAGMIGVSGTIGTALVGAGIGGLGASAAGVNPAIGAAIGGLGAFGKAGGFQSMFGGAAAPAAGAAAMGTAGAAATGAATTGAAAVAPAVAAAAPAAGGFFSGLNVGNVGALAMSMFGKAPQDLTPEEREAIKRNQEIAATERGIFDQQLAGARSLLQQGEANPERAFAETQLATQRGLRDVERTGATAGRAGLQTAERRRAAIEGARMGTAAVSGEQARAAQAKVAGLQALPTSVPTSASELNMAIYKDLYQRRGDYARDLSEGFGQMYGNLT